MKRYNLSCLLVILFCLSSCNFCSTPTPTEPSAGTYTASVSTETSTGTSTTSAPTENSAVTFATPASIDTSIEMSAIKNVIQNKKEYFCTVYGKSVFLKDFHSISYMNYETNEYCEDKDNNTNHVYRQFCVVDLDGDGVPELILESETAFGNELIFHYENGVVYGYVFALRDFKWIKKDGSFLGSGSAAHEVVGKFSFSKYEVIFNELCLFNKLIDVYRINGKNVSQEEVRKHIKKQDKKKDAEWYTYDEKVFPFSH